MLDRVYFTAIERIRNIEKLLFCILISGLSIIIITHPESIPKYFGENGIIYYAVIGYIFLNLSIIYFVKLTFMIILDTSNFITKNLENNKKWIGYPIVILIVILISIIVRNYFGIEWKNYIIEIASGIVLTIILSYQKIIQWIANMKYTEN